MTVIIVNNTSGKHDIDLVKGEAVLMPYAKLTLEKSNIPDREIKRLSKFCKITEQSNSKQTGTQKQTTTTKQAKSDLFDNKDSGETK